MDTELNLAILAAKPTGRDDPNHKAKSLFIRLFKNEEFRVGYNKWKYQGGHRTYGKFQSEKDFKKLLKASPSLSLPDELYIDGKWQFEFLASAIYSFALFGKVLEWPIFGCRLSTNGMDGYEEPIIIIEPDASQKDVIAFVRKNWQAIKKISSQDPYPRLGKIRSEKNPKLNSIIFDLHRKEHLGTSKILERLRNDGYVLPEGNPIVYITAAINREKRRHLK